MGVAERASSFRLSSATMAPTYLLHLAVIISVRDIRLWEQAISEKLHGGSTLFNRVPFYWCEVVTECSSSEIASGWQGIKDDFWASNYRYGVADPILLGCTPLPLYHILWVGDFKKHAFMEIGDCKTKFQNQHQCQYQQCWWVANGLRRFDQFDLWKVPSFLLYTWNHTTFPAGVSLVVWCRVRYSR